MNNISDDELGLESDSESKLLYTIFDDIYLHPELWSVIAKDESAFDVVTTISNAGMIFFLNGPNALHGVGKRPSNGLYRRYFNIVGETPIHIF
tara:strand:- start:6 stop:284 length:279 start_codon:yes stop_codon:yes gene_type:complete